MSTNITLQHQDAFDALTSGRFGNFALFSCRVDGQPACAIVAIDKDGDDHRIEPLFVSVTDGMSLTDHDGRKPADES
jgi:hypothetical protein